MVRNRWRGLGAPGVVAAVLLAGCGDEAETSAAALPEVRDSAGVTIVENAEPRLAPGAWTIDPEPRLVLGTLDGEAPYQFSGVGVVAEFPDGRFAILERDPPEIRIFDPEGVHLRTVGRPGDGPGEFQRGPAVALQLPDTLVTWDAPARRVSWFDGEGRLVRDTSYADRLGGAGPYGEVAADGSILIQDGGTSSGTRTPVFYSAPDAPMVRLGEYPGTQRHSMIGDDGMRRTFSGPPFGYLFTANLTGPDQITIVGGPEWELRQLDRSGELVRIIRAAVPREPVTSEMLDDHIATAAEQMRTDRGMVEEAYEVLGVPDSLPALSGVVADAAGNLWVQRWKEDWRADTTWDVFDADGRWITTVEVPADIGFLNLIAREHVYASWLDEYDVPYIKIHALRKGEG